MFKVKENDILFIMTDGFHENFDEKFVGNKYKQNNLTRETYLCGLIEDSVNIMDLANNMSEHVVSLTQPSRKFSKDHPHVIIPKNIELYPGKCDHSSLIVINVTSFKECMSDILNSIKPTYGMYLSTEGCDGEFIVKSLPSKIVSAPSPHPSNQNSKVQETNSKKSQFLTVNKSRNNVSKHNTRLPISPQLTSSSITHTSPRSTHSSQLTASCKISTSITAPSASSCNEFPSYSSLFVRTRSVTTPLDKAEADELSGSTSLCISSQSPNSKTGSGDVLIANCGLKLSSSFTTLFTTRKANSPLLNRSFYNSRPSTSHSLYHDFFS